MESDVRFYLQGDLQDILLLASRPGDMRVLIFHQFYTRLSEPGIARFNLFARYWKKAGVDVDVIASSINHATGKEREGSGFSLFTKEYDESGVTIYRAYGTTIGYWSFLGRLLSYISFATSSFFTSLFAPKPDVIVASAPPIFLGFVAWAASALRGVPFVFEMRDIWPDEAIELGVIKNKFVIKASFSLERFLYRHADFIMTNSPGTKKFLIEKKGIIPERVGVVPNPVNFEEEKTGPKTAHPKEKFGWQDKTVVLYSGAHTMVYNFDTVLDAAHELKKDPEILIVLMGDGRQKQHVRERVEKEGLTNVKLMASVPNSEVPAVLAAADICIAPLSDMRLLKYIYATKIFSYMAAERPIILLMEGVSKEAVEAGKCGITLAPGDSHGFVKAVRMLAHDPLMREMMGKSGYRFVREYAAADRLAEEYLHDLSRVLAGKGRA